MIYLYIYTVKGSIIASKDDSSPAIINVSYGTLGDEHATITIG